MRLRAPPERNRADGRAGRLAGPAGLEPEQPLVERRLPEAPIPAEAHVWDSTGAGLRPDPFGVHLEKLGDLLGCQELVHVPNASSSEFASARMSVLRACCSDQPAATSW